MFPANKKLTITLYFSNSTGSLLLTVNIFGIGLSTASKITHEVCKGITERLGSKYIRLPKTEEEIIQKAEPMLHSIENAQDYYCYKMFSSLIVLAVSDYRVFFMDANNR